MEKVCEIHVVQFGPPETGVWCDQCLLPSAIRVNLAGQHEFDVLDMGSAVFCHQHEGDGKP